ncbi:type IV pilus assembly protein PilM [Candidatus Saccharibacteria bacterium]|nr:type IV pilus assembly protein PilM [Candidatus Saccharibacteria bacterium]
MSLLHGVGEFFALDIGTNSIRLIQLSGDNERGWVLEKYAYVPVDPKVTQDDSDVGRRKMGEIVLGAVQQAGIRTKNIALGLPARKTYTAVIEVPNAPEKELDKTIKYELDQYIPMAIDEAKVDYAILGESPIDNTKAEVLVSSTAITYAEERMESMEALGLNVIAQEPEPIAMARALAPVGITDARLIIDVGETSTDLVMVYNGAPRLVRSVPGGLSLFVKTVSTALSVREDQARQFILKFGLAQDKLDGQVFNALDSTLEGFAGELTKSVRFFQQKYTNTTVGGIILSGFAGVIPFIAEYIEVKTGVATVQGNPWQFVRVSQEQQNALLPVASEYAVAIGLAERSNE